MNTLSTFLAVPLIALGATSHATETVVEWGYDSNPHKISSPDSGAQFTRAQIKHNGEKVLEQQQKLKYSLRLDSYFYEGGSTAADNHRFDGRIRWANRFKIGKRTANFLVTGDMRSERKTYFSQSQRQVAETSSGDSLEDRFNYDSLKMAGEFIYRFDRQKSLSLHSYVTRRDYQEDYSDLDIESLDYTEVNLQPSFRYKTGNGSYVRAFVYHKVRYYDELMNDNLDGRNIEGDEVELTMQGYGILYKRNISKRLDIKVYLNGYFARDNADGYRDLNYQKLEFSGNYAFDHGGLLSWRTNLYSRDYLEDSARPPESETGNSGRLREGVFSEVIYSYPLINIDGNPLRWQLRATGEWEDNSDDYFTYDRQIMATGLHYQF
ncbi:hypothetical protein R50073_15980 [Maricurvus nonylphenolicus]|uniref:hypothetical protein n=1 Tax=Maricurvus nonylphenolicus TaxID=1008307 RepID=UPI0036F2085A